MLISGIHFWFSFLLVSSFLYASFFIDVKYPPPNNPCLKSNTMHIFFCTPIILCSYA